MILQWRLFANLSQSISYSHWAPNLFDSVSQTQSSLSCMVVNAIAYETNSIVLDLSPNFIDGKYPGGKKKDDEMVATVMLVAKEY